MIVVVVVVVVLVFVLCHIFNSLYFVVVYPWYL